MQSDAIRLLPNCLRLTTRLMQRDAVKPMASLILSASLCAAPAAAKEAVVIKQSVSDTQPTRILLGSQPDGMSTCKVGSFGSPSTAMQGYIQPPDDSYFTLIQPSQCGSGQESIRIGAMHIVLLFPTLNCSPEVTVSLVGVQDTSSCPKPDTANVLVQPVSYRLAATIPDFPIVFIAPLDDEICLAEPAFLSLTFDAFRGCRSVDEPFLVLGQAACQECTQWNYYTQGGPGEEDFCIVLSRDFGMPLPLISYAEVESCTPTAVLPASWGDLKIRYANP